MSSDKGTPATPPPAIAPRKAVPRPPTAQAEVPAPAGGTSGKAASTASVKPPASGQPHGPQRTTAKPKAKATPKPAFPPVNPGGTTTATEQGEQAAQGKKSAQGTAPGGFAGAPLAAPGAAPTAPAASVVSAAPSTAPATAEPAGSDIPERKPAIAASTPEAAPAANVSSGPRKVKLSIARVDPWSVMKLSFLLSVAIGIMMVVGTWVFWYSLNNLGVFTSIDEMIRGIAGSASEIDILQYVERDRVLSLGVLIAVIDIVLLTALATIGAFLYNIVAALVGGIHLTMTDD